MLRYPPVGDLQHPHEPTWRNDMNASSKVAVALITLAFAAAGVAQTKSRADVKAEGKAAEITPTEQEGVSAGGTPTDKSTSRAQVKSEAKGAKVDSRSGTQKSFEQPAASGKSRDRADVKAEAKASGKTTPVVEGGAAK
jgi:hypothetical protein